MKLTLTIEREELYSFVHSITPLRIHMTEHDVDEKWVELASPQELDLVAHQELRLIGTGRARYTALGMALPLKIRRIDLMLMPKVISSDNEHPMLSFNMRLDHLDFEKIPDLIDREIQKRVNATLLEAGASMQWPFAQVLSHRFAMPERLEPLEQIGIHVQEGSAIVHQDRIDFTVSATVSTLRLRECPEG